MSVGSALKCAYEEHLEARRREGWPEGWLEGWRQGWLEGQCEQARKTLALLLEQRFGPLDGVTQRRLERAAFGQLETWTRNVLATASLEALLGPEPRRKRK